MGNFPFLFSGVSAGLKKSNKKDLGIIYSPIPCIAAGVFTKNRYPSPHVVYGKQLLPSQNIRAVIVNSGQSLAGTGQVGIEKNQQIIDIVSQEFKINQNSIITSATGIIGECPIIKKIKLALPQLKKNLTPEIENFSEAILTTDLKTKIKKDTVTIDEKTYQIFGVTKGSGMIAPNMATMLSYIVTDFPFELAKLKPILKKIAEKSFNCVSVDGDTSTSDSFFLISSQQQKISESATQKAVLKITEVAQDLAKQIATDGEGANHLIELKITNSPTKEIAASVLNKILNSPLVKTCIHGCDPNWGRLLMALGNGLAEHKLDDFFPAIIKIQGQTIFYKVQPTPFNAAELIKKMQKFEVIIEIDLLLGKHSLTGWGCDLSKEYITINADYRT